MEIQHVLEYIHLLSSRYHSVSSIWLIGSRASCTEQPESDWDLLVFADTDSLVRMRADAGLHALGIDLLVVTDGDRFEQPWIEDGYTVAKFGYLTTWLWKQTSQTEAEYLSSRRQELVPAVRLWPRG
jgi:predicted nucleotidyltransferase